MPNTAPTFVSSGHVVTDVNGTDIAVGVGLQSFGARRARHSCN